MVAVEEEGGTLLGAEAVALEATVSEDVVVGPALMVGVSTFPEADELWRPSKGLTTTDLVGAVEVIMSNKAGQNSPENSANLPLTNEFDRFCSP